MVYVFSWYSYLAKCCSWCLSSSKSRNTTICFFFWKSCSSKKLSFCPYTEEPSFVLVAFKFSNKRHRCTLSKQFTPFGDQFQLPLVYRRLSVMFGDRETACNSLNADGSKEKHFLKKLCNVCRFMYIEVLSCAFVLQPIHLSRRC